MNSHFVLCRFENLCFENRVYACVRHIALDGSKWSSRSPHLLYAQGKSPHCLLNMRVGGPHSWSEHFEEHKMLPSPAGNRTTIPQLSYRLCYPAFRHHHQYYYYCYYYYYFYY